MMAVYIDKDQMYFWVIITESHQYILSVFQSLILTPVSYTHLDVYKRQQVGGGPLREDLALSNAEELNELSLIHI